MKRHYDIAIVGAGPAGSTAARWAAATGCSVALFERDREIGVPVRCAEGVSEEGIEKFVNVDSRWIAASVYKFRFIAPNGKFVESETPYRGLILNRRLFDSDLASLAAEKGAEVYTKANVTGLDYRERVNHLHILYQGKPTSVTANIVIAADGVESRIARFRNIRTQLALRDIESCAQALLADIDIDPQRADFYLSHRWVPGGYVWVFPKGEHSANVGLGINGEYTGQQSALAYLEAFIDEKFPQAKRLTTVAGGVPVANNLKELVADGLMVVGDAAHQVNPLTGGGITSAMAAGKLAGEVAAQAIAKGDFSVNHLKAYQKEWNKTIGKDYGRFYRLKEWNLKLTDEEYDEIAETFQGIDPKEVTLSKIFKEAVKKKPSLILDVLKVFAGF